MEGCQWQGCQAEGIGSLGHFDAGRIMGFGGFGGFKGAGQLVVND
jgi:hypothetical protein